MPMGLVKTPRDEELWSKAKAAAKKQGHTEDWAYINGIYQRMKGHKKTAGVISGLRKAMGVREMTPEEQEIYRWKYYEGASPDARKAMALIGGPAEGFDELDWYEALMAYEDKHGVKIPESDWGDPTTFKFPDPNKLEKRADIDSKKGFLLISLEKSARVLSTRGRKQVAKKNFAMPASAAKSGKGQKGSYPIYDLPRARSALTYGKRFLSADEYAKLRARVYAKYPNLKKGNDMSKRGSILDGLLKKAGKVPGVPDATGPYGRGLGPGKGTKSGLGLIMAKMEKGEKLTEEEKAILETAKGKIKK